MKYQLVPVYPGSDTVRGEFAGKQSANLCQQRPLGADLGFEMFECWFVFKQVANRLEAVGHVNGVSRQESVVKDYTVIGR